MDGKKTVSKRKRAIPAAVRRAMEYVLVCACLPIFFFALRPAVAYALAHYHACCSERCGSLMVAQNPELSAVWLGMLWCGLVQAAAAALALLLPCCRPWVRRALAHIALAVTIVGHYKYAVAVGLQIAAITGVCVAANPGLFLLGRIASTVAIVCFAVGDLVHLLGLLQLAGGED